MVELNDIRVGTKFRVTWADKYCGVSKGQVVTVDSIYRGCSKDFRRPRIKNGYIITRQLGFDHYCVVATQGVLIELKRISDHRGCHVKTMKIPFLRARYDARRMRRLARNAIKFKKPDNVLYGMYKGIARNAGK
ncbi:hypothetical protein H1N91_gp19 [Escherichia phage grams]|uniref:Uncharacterized protein n=1 Tax=Escherichia phage grams TaxID=2696401 RepID=A0A6B9WMT8_9CAUD|nr:hypothetical protein H1N91_gp19 [Escherichia phage grams]QHR65210.1 hypothetical protein grams_19 [Escherichia phage grams]